MTEARNEPTRVELEAADWFSRLMHTRIENEELDAYALWVKDPANRDAYTRIDKASRLARALADDPEMRAAAREVHTRRAKPASWWRHLTARPERGWGVGLAFAGLVAAVILGIKAFGPTYQTPVGGQRLVELADGTKVRLNTDTALKVRFNSEMRRIELLRGQAFFDVAHDPAHPFIVRAGDTEVRAIGTQFDVRREAEGVQVVLARGKVSVTEQGVKTAPWILAPGEALATGPRAKGQRPRQTNVTADTRWTTGQVTFTDTPFPTAVAEINRYSRSKIVLGEGAPLNGRVNGTFPVGQPEDFIANMTELYGLQRTRRLDGAIELQASRPAGS